MRAIAGLRAWLGTAIARRATPWGRLEPEAAPGGPWLDTACASGGPWLATTWPSSPRQMTTRRGSS
eukprot:12255215-Heterocapsa_arctica.AAC.1